MTIEENKILKADLSKCDSVGNANEKINSAAIKRLQTNLQDATSVMQLKDDQIRKLESVPRQTIKIDERKWWEVPLAIIGGTVFGIVIQKFLIK